MTENPQDSQPPQYGTPPPADPPAPQYGAPPQYGTPGQPPQYGTPPQYGAPPQYGTPGQPPQYGTPPQYGAPQYGAPQQFAGPGGVGPVSDSDRQTWSMLAHLGGIVLSFIAPLVVWAMYKDRDEFVKDQATEALNFQITLVIGYVIASVLSAVLIGLALIPLLWVANLVLSIMAGMAANRGERYRYPWAVRLVK